MEKYTENNFEFITGSDIITCTLSERKWVNKVKKLAENFPSLVEIVGQNMDGSIVAHIPMSCLSIRTPKVDKK